MAARSFTGPRRSPAPLLAALGLAFSYPAAAIGLGDIRIQSYLGEPLEATVTVFASPGETVTAECFSLVHAGTDGLPAVSQARFTFEPDATPPRVRVRTTAPQNEPVLQLRLKASCPGGGGFARDYAILLDPVPVIVPPVVAQPAVSTAAAVVSPTAAATTAQAPSAAAPGLRAMSGDSLASIATAIYPRNRGARDAYIEALRAQNSGVAGLGPNDPIPEGTLLALPDLREFANTLGARPRVAQAQTPPPAPARPPRKAAPPAAPRAESAPPPRVETPPRKSEPAPAKAEPPSKKPEAAPAPKKAEPPAPKAAPAPKTAPKAEPPVAKPEAPAPKAEPPKAPPEAQRPAGKAPAKADAGGEFVLRLSSPDLDLSRSSAMDEKMRAQMRERLLLLDSDDQISALLSMRNNLRALENQVAQLQQRLVAADAAGGSASGTGTGGAPGAQTGAGSGATTAGVAPSPGAGALPASAKPTPRAEPGFVESIPVWVWGLFSVIAAAVAAFVGAVVAMKRMGVTRPAAGPGEAGGPSPARRAPQTAATPAAVAAATGTPQGIAQRFPELADGSVDMDDPDSVVGAAQRLYKQGSLQRAIDLLQFAVAERPAEMKPWLALFELFHLEAYPHEFSELAARFQRQHGDSDTWRKVQEIGRDLDPANPLYAA